MQPSYIPPRLIACLLALTSVALCAEEAPALSLPEVVATTLARYPDRPLSDAIHAQSQALRSQASNLFADGPALVMRHESDAANDDAGYRQWETGVALPLWLPGQRGRRLQVAEATERESAATARLHTWQVAGQVRELLWSLAIANAELDNAQHALRSAKDLEADVARRVQAGELPRSDLIMANKETLAREIELASRQSARDTALLHYRHVTGLDVVPRDIREAVANVTETAGDADHPAVNAARERVARAGADRDRIRAERRANPVLTLGGKSDRADANQDFANALFVEVNIPLGTRGQAAVDSAAAERGLVEATADLMRVQQELEHDLHATQAERELTARTVALAERQQALSAQALQLARRGFELGESDLFMLLQARAQALTAERDLNVRRLEQGRAAARVNQALGVIPQ